MNKTNFGDSLLIDLYDCTPGLTNDLEFTYRFLEELVHVLKMTPMSQPVVYHAPSKFINLRKINLPVLEDVQILGSILNGSPIQDIDFLRIETFPDKAGVSGWQPLIESGIQIHTINENNFVTIDVYTCGTLEVAGVASHCARVYGAKAHESYHILRGVNFKQSKD